MKLFTIGAPPRQAAAAACRLLTLGLAASTLFLSGCAWNQKAQTGEAATAPPKKSIEAPMPAVDDALPDEPLDDLGLIPNIRVSHLRRAVFPNRYYYYIESQLRRRRGDMEGAIHYLKKALEIDTENDYLQRDLTNLYLRDKQNAKALEVMESLVAQDPDNVELLVLFGKLKQGAEDMAGARDAYKKVLALAPDQEEIYILLGNLYMEEENYSRSAQVFGEMVRRFPDSYAGHYLKGRAAQEQGEYRSAAESFEQALSLEPDLDEARFSLIDVFEAQGFHDRSERLYHEILAEDPDNIQALFGLALLYHETGRTAAAGKLIRPLGKKASSEPDILRKIIQIYINEKAYKEAAVLLEKMLESAPENDDIHYVLGVALSELERESEAIDHLLQVSAASMFFQNAAVHIAFLYQEQGELEKAVDFMEQAVRQRPDNLDFRLYLASFHEERENYEAALKVLQDALEMAAESPRIYFRMGVIHDKTGDKAASIQAMRRVIELEPDNANALNYLGYTLADMGKDLEEAEKLIRRALELKPDDGYITDSLGWVYYQQGRYEKALELLERAADLAPDDPVILEHLGDAYRKLGRKQEALEFYRRSLEQKEPPEDAAAIREKIRNLTETLSDKQS